MTLFGSLRDRGLGLRLGSGIGWNLVGSVFNQGSTLAVTVVAARLLERRVFGEYAILQTTLLTMSSLAQLASGYTATKYLAEFRHGDKERAGRVLKFCSRLASVMALVSTGALILSAPRISIAILHAPGLAAPLQLSAGILLFSVLNGFQMGALAGLEAYPRLGVGGIVGGGSYFVLGVLGVWRYGLEGLVIGLTLSGLIQWIALRHLLGAASRASGIDIPVTGISQEMPILWRFTLPAALSGLVSLPALWAANALLVRSPGGLSQMALYAAANSLRSLVLFLPLTMNSVGMSLLSNQRGSGDDRGYRTVFWTNWFLTAGIVIVSGGLCIALGPWILRIFGPRYAAGSSVLTILIFSTLPEGLTVATYQALQSQGRLWASLLLICVPRDASIVLLAAWLVPGRGAEGLALAYTVGSTIALVAVTGLVARDGLGKPPAGLLEALPGAGRAPGPLEPRVIP